MLAGTTFTRATLRGCPPPSDLTLSMIFLCEEHRPTDGRRPERLLRHGLRLPRWRIWPHGSRTMDPDLSLPWQMLPILREDTSHPTEVPLLLTRPLTPTGPETPSKGTVTLLFLVKHGATMARALRLRAPRRRVNSICCRNL